MNDIEKGRLAAALAPIVSRAVTYSPDVRAVRALSFPNTMRDLT